MGDRRAAPHRHQPAVDPARARSGGPSAAPVGSGPSDPAGHARRGGRGSPHRPDGEGSRRSVQAQSGLAGDAPVRCHRGRGVREPLHVRRADARARDPGACAVLRTLARDRRHGAGLRAAPRRAPDAPVTPADRAVDPEDAEPPLAPRRAGRLLPGRADHLDAPRAGSRGHLVGQPGQRRSTTADVADRSPPDGGGVEAQVCVRARLGDGLRRHHAGWLVRAPALRRAGRRSRGRRHLALRAVRRGGR